MFGTCAWIWEVAWVPCHRYVHWQTLNCIQCVRLMFDPTTCHHSYSAYSTCLAFWHDCERKSDAKIITPSNHSSLPLLIIIYLWLYYCFQYCFKYMFWEFLKHLFFCFGIFICFDFNILSLLSKLISCSHPY